MHPDQMYELQQLRHRDLWAEVERARVQRTCSSNRASWGSAWLAAWLRWPGIRRLRRVMRTVVD
jgi:hypothetical protein